jgi:predicted metal-dependent hydrolase
MSLTVRRIPFDLSLALRGESRARLAADFGRPFATFLMAANIWAEWAEMLIVHMRKKYGVFSDTEDTQTFVVQEARHAAALHQVNRQLFGKASHVRDAQLGRVPLLAHPIMSRALRLGERADASFREDLRNVVLYITALEATFALVSTASAANVLERMESAEAQSPYMSHAAFFYVFFYHNAEEAEHSHVSWEFYERTFGPIADVKTEFAAKVKAGVEDLKQICLAISRDDGSGPLEEPEIDAVIAPMLAVLLARADRFDHWTFQESRRSFIRAWDETWEPRFRARSEELAEAIQ